MRMCSIKELTVDMVLGKSIFTHSGQLLLRSGYKIGHEELRRIRDLGIAAVFILEEGTEEIIPVEVISEEVRSSAKFAFSKTMDKVSEVIALRKDIPANKLGQVIKQAAEYRNCVDAERVTGEVSSIVDEIMESSSPLLNQILIKSKTGRHTEHAVDTALLAILMGRHANFLRRELLELGTGAFLHDLGKLALPKLMEKAPAEMTDDERLLMREHPVLGRELFSCSTDRFFMAQAGILHHHERQDGMGYPQGLRGTNAFPVVGHSDTKKQIFVLGEIIAVADAYDNLVSQRNGHTLSPEQAIGDMVKQARTAFNAEVVNLLSKVVCVYPTGAMVSIAECSNRFLVGAQGVIMKANEQQPHHPIVILLRNSKGQKTTPKTVDLTAESFVRLELAL